jgi:hypothetical protein
MANKWRRVVVEVSADLVHAWWDGDDIGKVTDHDLSERFFGDKKPETPVSYFHFDPHGGLGLYVNRGTASFRNVQVEPLP